MSEKKSPESDVPDLRKLLAEASRPSASVTVPMKQGLAEAIRQAEAELANLAVDAPKKRMGAGSPLQEKAKRIEALRAEMAASALTFHFEAPTKGQRDQVREDMAGRDNEDELDLRATAAVCSRVVAADGSEFPDALTWQDFQSLRDDLGVQIYDATIKVESDKVWGPQWSVPFSSAASLILGTEK